MSDAVASTALSLASRTGGPILAVDTSAADASLCLCVPHQQAVAERQLAAASLPSESLVSALAGLLEQHQLRPQDLKALVVSLGPGSFTGLRVGLATVKGLALGSGVAAFGVSSLAVLAASSGPGWVAPVLDARRGDVFAALYEVQATGHAHARIEDCVVPVAAWPQRLQAQALAQLPRYVGDFAAHYAQASPVAPRAACAIVLAEAQLLAGQAPPLAELVPRYLRVSEAERQLGK